MTNVDTSTPVSNDNNTAAPQDTPAAAAPKKANIFSRIGGGIKAAAASNAVRKVGAFAGQTAYLIGVSAATLVVAGAVTRQLPKVLRSK